MGAKSYILGSSGSLPTRYRYRTIYRAILTPERAYRTILGTLYIYEQVLPIRTLRLSVWLTG